MSAPLADGGEWLHFSGAMTARTYFNGAISNDEFHFPSRSSRGMTIRLFDPDTEQWSLYWVSSLDGKLNPPVRGGFSSGVGEFYRDSVRDGQPTRIRYRWRNISHHEASWELALSTDSGASWNTNWEMRLQRTADDPPVGPT